MCGIGTKGLGHRQGITRRQRRSPSRGHRGQEFHTRGQAIASAPRVLTLAEADAELQRLNLLKKNHVDEQYVHPPCVVTCRGRFQSRSERVPT